MVFPTFFGDTQLYALFDLPIPLDWALGMEDYDHLLEHLGLLIWNKVNIYCGELPTGLRKRSPFIKIHYRGGVYHNNGPMAHVLFFPFLVLAFFSFSVFIFH